jgi:carbon-monoxide dehydrogenase large subunit
VTGRRRPPIVVGNKKTTAAQSDQDGTAMGTNANYQGRIEDDRFITGQGQYIDDVKVPNCAHGVVVRSPWAHADLKSVDVEDARSQPGVLAIYTAADLAAEGIGDQPCGVKLPRPDGQEAFQAQRRVLARDKVRHLGEPVAFVVAETRQQALDAAELVMIDGDERDVATDARAAKADGAPLVWDEVPNNHAFVWSKGDQAAVDSTLASAAHVAHLDTHVTRVIPNAMEPRGTLAYIGDDGRLTVHSSTQGPFPLRNGLANLFGLQPDEIKVIASDVGGSFGMKMGVYPEDVLVSLAARKLSRPVRWISDRSEGILSDEHGRDVRMTVDLGLDADGNFLALKVICDVNIGAFLSGRSLGMIGNFGGIAGVYRIGDIFGVVNGIHTHTQVTAPYRGAGRPEATFAIERVIDVAAREMGIDPYQLRLRNLIPADAMPYDTGFTYIYDCGEFEQNMREVARLADYEGFAARRKAAEQRGKLRGLGISNPIESAGGPFVKPAKDQSRLAVAADGTVTIYTGSMSVGQGTETAFSNLVAERLNVPVESVVYSQGETDTLTGGRGNGGSSATPVGASSVLVTIDNLIAEATPMAAEMLQTNADSVSFEDGAFTVSGTGASVTLKEVAAFAAEKSPEGLAASGEFDPPAVTYPNGSHMCEVEIDPDTGEIEIVTYSVCEDIGRVLNHTLAAGQMHGGIVQGAGQALFETSVHDADTGQLMTGSFMDYAMPRADDFPSFQFVTREVPTAINPMGAKGIGEAGSVGSIAAVINAICDALQPYGVTDLAMPATPNEIWKAINARKAA